MSMNMMSMNMMSINRLSMGVMLSISLLDQSVNGVGAITLPGPKPEMKQVKQLIRSASMCDISIPEELSKSDQKKKKEMIKYFREYNLQIQKMKKEAWKKAEELAKKKGSEKDLQKVVENEIQGPSDKTWGKTIKGWGKNFLSRWGKKIKGSLTKSAAIVLLGVALFTFLPAILTFLTSAGTVAALAAWLHVGTLAVWLKLIFGPTIMIGAKLGAGGLIVTLKSMILAVLKSILTAGVKAAVEPGKKWIAEQLRKLRIPKFISEFFFDRLFAWLWGMGTKSAVKELGSPKVGLKWEDFGETEVMEDSKIVKDTLGDFGTAIGKGINGKIVKKLVEPIGNEVKEVSSESLSLFGQFWQGLDFMTVNEG